MLIAVQFDLISENQNNCLEFTSLDFQNPIVMSSPIPSVIHLRLPLTPIQGSEGNRNQMMLGGSLGF